MMRTEIEWTTDIHGVMQNAKIHDATITSINFLDNDFLSIQIKRVDGSSVLIECTQINDANISLRNGAIISEIYIWNVKSAPFNFQISDNGWNTLYGSVFTQEDIKIKINEVIDESPEDFLFQISFSYGGEIALLCAGVRAYV